MRGAPYGGASLQYICEGMKRLCERLAPKRNQPHFEWPQLMQTGQLFW